LPDEVLCHILSFLPTKLSVSTSILSKRWRPLWRSVPALDFDYSCNHLNKISATFLSISMCTFILSRNLEQPIQRFRLTNTSFGQMTDCDCYQIKSFVRAVGSTGRVQHLDLTLCYALIDISSDFLFCKTLRVLKLNMVTLKSLPWVDFPLLKVLHLHDIKILDGKANLVPQILSACPKVEDLEVEDAFDDYEAIDEYKRLPKLFRAVIEKYVVPLKVVKNVQLLIIRNKLILLSSGMMYSVW
ncbi:FBD-associated F-box protein At5g18780-like, partial [Vigna unguiculata]|uniref:FBD-associated F-box protein At5g18780-like n=1 Tax=Vigna unguiculata TaxID=3917 RepID=UPI00101609DC